MSEDTMSQMNPIIVNSAATTNGRLIQAGGTTLKTLVCTNTGAAAAFVKLYNLGVAPTVGTSIPVMTLSVPPNGVVSPNLGIDGMYFPSGLAMAITLLGPDADATVLGAAGEVKVSGNFHGN
jgi:hypothetical protein